MPAKHMVYMGSMTCSQIHIDFHDHNINAMKDFAIKASISEMISLGEGGDEIILS